MCMSFTPFSTHGVVSFALVVCHMIDLVVDFVPFLQANLDNFVTDFKDTLVVLGDIAEEDLTALRVEPRSSVRRIPRCQLSIVVRTSIQSSIPRKHFRFFRTGFTSAKYLMH
jgi:hypothetical protein